MGNTVNFRTKKLSYKDKNSVHNSPEDWIIFENTQEAIADEETWLTVQKIRETKHRPSKKGDINTLTGLVYCADCCAKIFNHRTNGYEKKDKNGNPTGKYTNAQDNYTSVSSMTITRLRSTSWQNKFFHRLDCPG